MGKERQPVIIHEDADIIVVNKPAGMLSIPDRHVPERENVLDFLRQQYGHILTVHRLDRETSGILVFARQADAHRHLSIQFEQREVSKFYLTLVDGRPLQDIGVMEQSIAPHGSVAGKMVAHARGKPARSAYTVRERYRHFTLLDVQIFTGRTHQIRVHCSAMGHPLAVDPLYGKREALFLSEIKQRNFNLGRKQEERPLLGRLSLHAYTLAFRHPTTEQAMHFEAAAPKDLRATLRQLGKWGA